MSIRLLYLFLLSVFVPGDVLGQVSIKEVIRVMDTYPYSDPNPVPSLAINDNVSRFYPYSVFNGYTTEREKKGWKVVEMENPFIKVTVLPEVGGKVMGAMEKSTGKEFIYTNHVMKFRAIGIRGPWASGGIEHNFGLDIGHAPWTSSPVDYVLRENEDGSVSCIVGGLDLASRTQWRVNIHLPKDKAYFETRSLWYNPTAIPTSYMSWENAAFKATDDLQFYFPGTHWIDHDGSAHSWPGNKQGRNLSLYGENDFGGPKSYHVMGKFTDWFGGYWHNADFGFGHWAPYSDAPGKKIWIWSLARSGAIWEDLLTDTDGQYIEAQSGVKFNQAAENSGFSSPFDQLSLGSFYSETKTEYWFPVKATDGMVDASPYGTLNVMRSGDSLRVVINPVSAIRDSLVVSIDGKAAYATALQLNPMEVYDKVVILPDAGSGDIRVAVGRNKLVYATDSHDILDRPVKTPSDQDHQSAEYLFRRGEDEKSMRNYTAALSHYRACLEKEPAHSRALTGMAELYYKQARYAEGLPYVRRVLAHNTYEAGANHMYGVLQRKLGNLTKAEEAFSISARSMAYRSGAYTQIAAIRMQLADFSAVNTFAKKALDYNRYNVMAYKLLGTCHRKLGNGPRSEEVFTRLLDIDPLNHYARFEQYLLQPTRENLERFTSGIAGEFPAETYLELALEYFNQGLVSEAVGVLEQAPAYPTVYYWLAYLKKDISPAESGKYLQRAGDMSPDGIFPFRSETIPVLDWAREQSDSWKPAYYLGLVHWSKLNLEKAKDLLKACDNRPGYTPFYLTRGILFQGDSNDNVYAGENFKRAIKLNPEEWRTWHYLTRYYRDKALFKEELVHAKKAYRLFPGNPVTGMDYARALLNTRKFSESIEVLHNVHILPQEGAHAGHDVYETACLALALRMVERKEYHKALEYLGESRKWPENLGAGKPYRPDTRLQDYIAAYCENKLGNPKKAARYYEAVASYTADLPGWIRSNPLYNFLGIHALRKKGENEKAADLIKQWQATYDKEPQDLEAQWAFAQYNNNKTAREKLEKKILANKNVNGAHVFFLAFRLTGLDKG